MKIIELKGLLKPVKHPFKTSESSRPLAMVLRYFAEAVGILLIAGYLFYDSVWVGLLFFPYVIYYIKRGLKNWERKRQEKISVEFKDGMQAVVSALTAGYSIENSFREAIGELELLYGKKTIIYEGFARIIFRLNLNTNVEEAFAEFAKECKVEEITSFSEILSYAKRSGGNLIQIIKNTTDTISEKIDVKREINTIISAKQLEQNIMNYVPLGIILYMRFTSGEMFQKVYGNPAGIILMTVCLLVYFAARIIAEKIVDIHV